MPKLSTPRVPSATSSESWEVHTWGRERRHNPYFLGCLDSGVQLFLCPWGFLNHLRGTAGRFLLAPACALPGIREYSCWSRVMWTIASEAAAWLLPNAAGLPHCLPSLLMSEEALREKLWVAPDCPVFPLSFWLSSP